MAQVNDVVTALVQMCEALRQEGVARKSYSGPDWGVDARGLIETSRKKREVFEESLRSYIKALVSA